MLKILSLIFLLFFLSPQKTLAAITFSISDPQYQGEEISVNISLSGLTSASCPNVSCYLQGGFTATTGTPRYFGFTKNHRNELYQYDGSPTTDYIKSTFFAFEPIAGSWSGRLVFKSDSTDQDYKGPGDYNLKLWRYTGNSSSGSSSDNILLVNITTPTATPTPTLSPTPSPTSSPTPTSKTPTPKPSTPKPTVSSTPTSTPKPTAISVKISKDIEESPLPSVLPAATKSAIPAPSPTPKPVETKVAAENNLQKILIGMGILLVISSAILAFRSFITAKRNPASQEKI